MRKPQVIAIANQKGGVGKTTTAVNLSASLALASHSVLLLDLDPQGNATTGSGHDKSSVSCSMNEVLLETVSIAEAIVTTPWCYDVIPSNGDLTVAEVRLLSLERREKKLNALLDALESSYKYIIIDCPPSLNMLTVNALVAADRVLIPVQCEYYALEGLTSLLKSIDHVQKTANARLHLEGIVRTMYDGRNRLTEEVSEQLQHHFSDKLYKTVIPRNVRVAEAPSHGKPVIHYDKASQGAMAYLALANELLQRQHIGVHLQHLSQEITL